VLRPPESREKILEVAEAGFAAKGYAGVGLREIAAAVGLGKSSLFHHFPTKLDLYGAVLEQVLTRLALDLDLQTRPEDGPAERLERWIDAIVRRLAEDAPAARLMLRAMVDQEPYPAIRLIETDRELMPFERRLAGILGRLGGLLEEGIAAGVFRPLGIPDAIQTVVGAVVFHFASGDLGEALIGEDLFSGTAVERRRREVVEFVCRGLRA